MGYDALFERWEVFIGGRMVKSFKKNEKDEAKKFAESKAVEILRRHQNED